MSETIRCVCPSCGKETLLEAGQKEFFCSHCGTKGAVPAGKTPKTRSNACNILVGNYHKYIEACEKIFQKTSTVGNAVTKFFGFGDKFVSDSMHETYRKRLELDVVALTEDLEEGSAAPADALRAAMLILQLDDSVNAYKAVSAMGVTLTSYEHMVLPVIRFIELDALQDMCAAYAKHRRELRFPNQKTVEDEIRRCIKEKGGQPPRVETLRWFGKKRG